LKCRFSLFFVGLLLANFGTRLFVLWQVLCGAKLFQGFVSNFGVAY